MEQQDVHGELADLVDALEILASRVRLDRLREGVTHARTLVQAALIHMNRAPLLSLAMRFLREFEKSVGDSPLTADARRLRERIAPFIADSD